MSLDDKFGPFAGRQTHPDMTTLSEIVVALDAASETPGFDFGAFLATFIDERTVTYMAGQRAMRSLATNGVDPRANPRRSRVGATR